MIKKVMFGEDEFSYEYLRGKEVVRFFKSPPDLGRVATIDIETYPRKSYVDHEGAAFLPVKSKIRLLQIAYYNAAGGINTLILDFMSDDGEYNLLNPWWAEQLQKLLHSTTLFAHNALFETAHLQNVFVAHFGGFKPLNIRCTMNMYRLLVSAQTPLTKTYPAGLGPVVQMITGVELPKEHGGSDWSTLELSSEQLDYAALDVIAPHHVAAPLAKDLGDYGMLDLFMLNTKAQEALAMMKIYGCHIDKNLHDKSWEAWKKKKALYHQECLGLLNMHLLSNTADDIRAALLAKVTKKWLPEAETLIADALSVKRDELPYVLDKLRVELRRQDEIEPDEKGRRRMLRRLWKNIDIILTSPDSPKQLSDWLKENVPARDLSDWPISEKTNWLKTDSEAFEDHDYLECVAPIAGYKKYAKLDGTYGEGLNKFFVYRGDKCVLFPNYSLCYTDTGRMSSYEPNLQNQPRDNPNEPTEQLRRIFIPSDEDHIILCADFSQIEIRVAAMLSGDEMMLRAYRDGIDLHAMTAASMARVSIEDVTKDMRQRAKAVNFGLLFGAGAATLKDYGKKAYKVLMTDEEAEEYVDIFRSTYTGYRNWQMKQAKLAEGRGWVKTPTGKHRRLFSDNTYTRSMNTPVQGGAAEIMLQAMINITHALCDGSLDSQLINVVHDEVIVNTAIEHKDEVIAIIKKSMEDALLSVFPEASLRDLVDVGEGPTWAEAK